MTSKPPKYNPSITLEQGLEQPKNDCAQRTRSQESQFYGLQIKNTLISNFPMSSVGARHNFPSAALFKQSVELTVYKL